MGPFPRHTLMDSAMMPDTGEMDKDNEVCVPLDKLSVDGTAPEEGDTVEIKATVTRVENGMAYVVPEDAVSDKAEGDTEMEPSFSDSGDYKSPM